jgi:hypothetical protein
MVPGLTLRNGFQDRSQHRMIILVASELKIVIVSGSPEQFEFFRETLTNMGHIPIVYLASRSLRPSMPIEAYAKPPLLLVS